MSPTNMLLHRGTTVVDDAGDTAQASLPRAASGARIMSASPRRILHSALMVTAPAGILNQMSWEQQAATQLGIPWRSSLFCRDTQPASSIVLGPESRPSAGIARILPWWELRRSYYAWLAEEQRNWDIILLRHSLSDPLQLRFMRRHGHKTILVHHTKEIEQLESETPPKSWVKSKLEQSCGAASLRLARGIIAVTPEIGSYEVARLQRHAAGKPLWTYPNGVLYADDAAPPEDKRGTRPELLFVASYFASWHGLDRLLAQAARSTADFTLHLVGTLAEADKAAAAGDRRIKLHGALSAQQIQALSNHCWLGLSSFALDRKGMQQACTLKVREYLANGLPVYAGHQEVLPPDFPYYQRGAPNVDAILAYAQGMRGVERETVRDVSRPFISKKILLNKLYAELCAAEI